MKIILKIFALLLAASSLLLLGRDREYINSFSDVEKGAVERVSKDVLKSIPLYYGDNVIEINGGIPLFDVNDTEGKAFEFYQDTDGLGRAVMAFSCVGRETLPDSEREPISSIRPSGWDSASYDSVQGGSLYNRCHLIAFSLTGENLNPGNLMTGTRNMNNAMGSYERMILDHIRDTGGHVLYRATPYFKGRELLARGILLEGCSVEDGGESVCFAVFIYNVQPGISIDYKTGESYEIQ